MNILANDVRPKPWKHQQQALDWCHQHTSSYLSMDMGSGKSRVFVDFAQEIEASLVLVITTKRGVMHVWPGQFYDWSSREIEVHPMEKGTVAKRILAAEAAIVRAKAGRGPIVIVANWEMLRSKAFEAWLKTHSWDAVALDESHKCKSHTGVGSKALARVSVAMNRMVMLSGTPMPHSPLDIFAQARVIAPEVFGPRFHAFQSRIVVMGGYRNPRTGKGTVPVEWINQDWLKEQLALFMFQPAPEDVELNLPPTRHIQVPVTLEPRTRALYDAVEADIIVQLGTGEINPSNGLVKLLRLQQLASGIGASEDIDDWGTATQTTVQIGTAKQDAVQEIIESTDQPIVVFCQFRAELDAIDAACEAAGENCAELSGRMDCLSAWKAGDARVLAVQIAAGSEALDFTRAHHCVFLSTGFNLGLYLQALKRCDRPGQTSPVTFYHISAIDTVDSRVYQALIQRTDLVRAALEGLGQ